MPGRETHVLAAIGLPGKFNLSPTNPLQTTPSVKTSIWALGEGENRDLPGEEEGLIGSRDQNITKRETETPHFQGNVRRTQSGRRKESHFW